MGAQVRRERGEYRGRQGAKRKEERGEKTQGKTGEESEEEGGDKGGVMVQRREDTKEQCYFFVPVTFSTINCCFTIRLVPMTTVLDSDASILHNNTHLL